MSGVKVSIVMPIYNAANFLDESISSILSQTEKNIELICVDDGSTDDSPTIIKKYAANDKRIKCISQKNAGGGAARNAGLKSACGDYLLFLDSDDVFEKTLVEETYDKAVLLNADVLVFGGDCFSYWNKSLVKPAPWLLVESELNKESITSGVVDESDKKSCLFKFTTTTVWNKLFKRSFIVENSIFFQEIYAVDTMFFVMMAMMLSKKISILNKVFVHYRIDNPNSQISNADKNFGGIFEALIAVRQKMKELGIENDYSDVFADFAERIIVPRMQLTSYGIGKKMLYEKLRQSGLKELGLTHGIIKNKALREMYEMDYESHLHAEINTWIENGLLPKKRYRMPCLTKKMPAKIVVYGAGLVGKCYFQQLLNRSDCVIASWVDKRYDKLGYPIENPEILEKLDFDMVVLAVNDKASSDEIKNYLERMGVSNEKIFWEKPESF